MKDISRATLFIILLLVPINCAPQQFTLLGERSPIISPISSSALMTPAVSRGNPPTPLSSSVSVTVTSLPAFTPPTHTPEPAIFHNPLPEFPLAVGNTWVYSATFYGHTKLSVNNDVEILTATYMITDQVIATRTYGLFFGAEILRISSLIDGTPYEMFHSTDLNWELENPNSKQYAYIISGTEVYQQIELDFKDLKARVSESGPHKYPLIYDFPFLNETGFSCWYDGTGEGGDCRIDRDNDWWWNGFYNVEEGPSPLKTPAGSFENCYMIKMAVQGGGRCQWFCLNIGIAGSTWTYQHQVPNHYPLTGYEIKLLSYSLIE